MRPFLMLFATVLTTIACSSTPYLMERGDDTDSTADPDSYTGMGFNYRKPMPDHRDDKSWQFYYKNCSPNGRDDVFSGRSYDCTGAH